MKSAYLILPATLIIISCSSTPKKPEAIEHFVTHITADGDKKFNYSLTVTNPKRGNKQRGKGGGGRNGQGSGRGGKGGQGRNQGGPREKSGQSNHSFEMKQRFLQKLERTLFEKDYCHEGYIKLDSFFDREMSQFRGKCEEKANKEDINKFPNQ